MKERRIARRTLIRSAGLGVGLGIGAGLSAGMVGRLGATRTGRGGGREALEPRILGQKGDVKLNLWRKRVGAHQPGEPPLPVLFLVHGSSTLRPLLLRPYGARARANIR